MIIKPRVSARPVGRVARPTPQRIVIAHSRFRSMSSREDSDDGDSGSSRTTTRDRRGSDRSRSDRSGSESNGSRSSRSEGSSRSSRSSSERNGSARSSSESNGSSGATRARRGAGQKSQKGKWAGLDNDESDDQQDIARGRDMVSSTFQGGSGKGGTHNAILSSEDYMSQAKKNLNNLEEGYYISPSFLDKMTVHIAKNYMSLPKIKVPLILGIWGGKGQGKTFQCMLSYKKLGINPIVMSAGELESGQSGEPAKLIRQRYREAADAIGKGEMSSLFINDLDAGAGRMGSMTQYTVNNQMVNATLMNIADNPTNVQLAGNYRNDPIHRVPIIATGNDFSTLYAPLIRDGRMEKYYWNPSREDRVGVCFGIFKDDNLNRGQVETIVDTFPSQSIDFFGALRARVYDNAVREFIEEKGLEGLGKGILISSRTQFEFDPPTMDLDTLLAFGQLVVAEQENVRRVQLANEYLNSASLAGANKDDIPDEYKEVMSR